VPFADDESVELRAARHDPPLMVAQLGRAFEHLLAVETAAQPIVIVLEDLMWGDLPSIKLIESALRGLADRPWLVLALARPEVHELFPRLWAERGAQEIRLDELGKKTSERLVRHVLAQSGAQTTDTLVARIVEQSGGNAFYLEELIRAACEARATRCPRRCSRSSRAGSSGSRSTRGGCCARRACSGRSSPPPASPRCSAARCARRARGSGSTSWPSAS